MNSMTLLLKSSAEPNEAPPIQWTLDCPTRGVVILDVAIGREVSAARLTGVQATGPSLRWTYA